MRCRGKTTLLVYVAITVSGLLLGCTKSEGTIPPSPLPTATRTSIDEAVSAYEDIRKALAQNRSNVRSEALALAGAAQAAAGSAPEKLRPSLEDLSASAQRLGAMQSDDLAEARRAFGETSRALIALLSSEPSLQPGRHVYECPMAKGYNKWVQLDETTSNPYMGSEMPECGAKAGF